MKNHWWGLKKKWPDNITMFTYSLGDSFHMMSCQVNKKVKPSLTFPYVVVELIRRIKIVALLPKNKFNYKTLYFICEWGRIYLRGKQATSNTLGGKRSSSFLISKLNLSLLRFRIHLIWGIATTFIILYEIVKISAPVK